MQVTAKGYTTTPSPASASSGRDAFSPDKTAAGAEEQGQERLLTQKGWASKLGRNGDKLLVRLKVDSQLLTPIGMKKKDKPDKDKRGKSHRSPKAADVDVVQRPQPLTFTHTVTPPATPWRDDPTPTAADGAAATSVGDAQAAGVCGCVANTYMSHSQPRKTRSRAGATPPA